MTTPSKNDLYVNFETALFREPGDPVAVSYPAVHPLASEFEEQMVKLVREYVREGECLSVHHPDEPGAVDDAPDCTTLALFASKTGKIGEISLGDEMASAAPKVFISYAWGNQAHQDWVHSLAERLMADGINVVLDIWDFKEGHDKFVFMESMVTDLEVKKVLIVSDARYAAKADDRQGGVGTESQIISSEVYDKVSQEKFLPLIRERDARGEPCSPVFLRNRKFIDFSNDSQFEESYEALIRNIHEKPQRPKPPLGKAPAHLEADEPRLPIANRSAGLRNAAEQGRPQAATMLREYLDAFIEGMPGFAMPFALDDPEFGTKLTANLNRFTPWRDNFVEVIELVSRYMDNQQSYERLITFFERIAEFQDRMEHVPRSRDRDWEVFRVIVYELFLYMIAVLIREEKYEAVLFLIEHRYNVKRRFGETGYADVGVGYFDLVSNSVGSIIELIEKRATLNKVPMADIVQADFVLLLRKYIPRGFTSNWDGRLAAWIAMNPQPRLFAKATSDIGFRPLQKLLRVNDRQQMVALIREIPFSKVIYQHNIAGRRFVSEYESLLNLQAIERSH